MREVCHSNCAVRDKSSYARMLSFSALSSSGSCAQGGVRLFPGGRIWRRVSEPLRCYSSLQLLSFVGFIFGLLLQPRQDVVIMVARGLHRWSATGLCCYAGWDRVPLEYRDSSRFVKVSWVVWEKFQLYFRDYPLWMLMTTINRDLLHIKSGANTSVLPDWETWWWTTTQRSRPGFTGKHRSWYSVARTARMSLCSLVIVREIPLSHKKAMHLHER